MGGRRKKISTTVYLEKEHLEILRAENERTGTPMAWFIREAVGQICSEIRANNRWRKKKDD